MPLPALFTLALLIVLGVGCGGASERDELQGQVTALHEEMATLQTGLAGDLEQALAENARLTGDLSSLRELAASLAAEARGLRAEKSLLETLAASLQEDLDEAAALAASLDTQVKALQSKVFDLEKKLDSYYVAGFLCTGSMEPYITCADTATWKRDFTAEDIHIGSVITFKPPAECGFTGGNVAHRVVEIAAGHSISYRTQGDNNRAPDPCWIPFASVDGVLARLHKNASPTSALDTTAYDEAIARARTLDLLYESENAGFQALSAEFGTAGRYYDEAYEHFCGFPPTGADDCALAGPAFTYLDALFAAQETLRVRVNASIRILNSVMAERKEAWAKVAALKCDLFNLCPEPAPQEHV